MTRRLALIALLLLPVAARADDPQQLAGLFMQACVMQPNAEAMRAWAVAQKLKELPVDAQSAFLGGAPGVAYDATDAAGKFVLAVRNNSNCAAFAEHAAAAALVASLEPMLQKAGASFTLENDTPDPHNHTLHERTYALILGGQPYTLLIGTSEDGGHAMLGLAVQ